MYMRQSRGLGGLYSLPDWLLGATCPTNAAGVESPQDSTWYGACRDYNNRQNAITTSMFGAGSLGVPSGPVVPPLSYSPVGVDPGYDPTLFPDSVVNDVIAGTVAKQTAQRLEYFQALDRQAHPENYEPDGTPKKDWSPLFIGAGLALLGVVIVKAVSR